MPSHPKTTSISTTSEAATIATNPEIHIRVATESDHERVLEFIRLHYYREEPLTAGSEPQKQEAADEEFNMSNIQHGTCLVATRSGGDDDEHADELVVGAVIAGPKDSQEVDHLFEDAASFGSTSKWGRILHFLACIERDANVFERYGIARALHTHVLGVHQAVRGQALGARLMQELISLGRSKNFELLTADCTSVYSARLCERVGMECINVVHYEDYCDKAGQQVFRPPPPHDCVKTYALRL